MSASMPDAALTWVLSHFIGRNVVVRRRIGNRENYIGWFVWDADKHLHEKSTIKGLAGRSHRLTGFYTDVPTPSILLVPDPDGPFKLALQDYRGE